MKIENITRCKAPGRPVFLIDLEEEKYITLPKLRGEILTHKHRKYMIVSVRAKRIPDPVFSYSGKQVWVQTETSTETRKRVPIPDYEEI